jgi:mycoredoxin
VDAQPVNPDQPDAADSAHEGAEIVVYWRPACGFCASLRRQLDASAVPHRLVDIWQDPEGAAAVRSITGGDETVPTVVVGSIGLVNPSVHEVLAVAATEAPDAVPEGYEPLRSRRRR